MCLGFFGQFLAREDADLRRPSAAVRQRQLVVDALLRVLQVDVAQVDCDVYRLGELALLARLQDICDSLLYVAYDVFTPVVCGTAPLLRTLRRTPAII